MDDQTSWQECASAEIAWNQSFFVKLLKVGFIHCLHQVLALGHGRIRLHLLHFFIEVFRCRRALSSFVWWQLHLLSFELLLALRDMDLQRLGAILATTDVADETNRAGTRSFLLSLSLRFRGWLELLFRRAILLDFDTLELGSWRGFPSE